MTSPVPDAMKAAAALVLVAVLSPLLLGCGNGDDDTAGGGGDPAVPTAEDADDSSTDPPTGDDAESDDAESDDAESDDAAAEVVEEHWFNEIDQFDRPRVRWTGIVENVGSQPVEVSVEIEALDADGETLGSADSQFPWLVAPGEQMPFSLAIGRLPTEATSVESALLLDDLPDFRAERVGTATFTGELVDVVFDDGRDFVVRADVEVENVGTVGWGPDFALAVYAADGTLVSGGWASANAEVLCPGDTTVVGGELTINPPPDFDPASADVRVHMIDFELAESVTGDC
ncbi:FxLYD domain-containing protein [Rhabdothermincola salaria]|uniref:FxLYD domain-containing protein n=1 Tax=Rhabdothermincola salaria TaxID=2903142 RepID=UPI001E38EBF1|nr:FxLYD domain-containing protein [Rhabdothermincola salaria]MCD9622684.1 FxLYD domain-containing protein [Rhabdothermincola salaria]